ncbi:MAG: hypothetical protein HFF98_12370 [Oscillibacter sp.]|nr:hypothetical protein [Oscillibacter sp.]
MRRNQFNKSRIYRTVIHQQATARLGYFDARFDEAAFDGINLKRAFAFPKKRGTPANAIKLTPEKTTPLRIMEEVGTTRKQTQEAAPGFLGLPTFQRFSRDG